MKQIYSALILLFFFSVAHAGSARKVDSLKQELHKPHPDSVRQTIYSALGWELQNVNSDTALYYEKIALQIAQNLKNEWRIASSYNHLGVIYWVSGDYSKATENLFRALELFEKQNKQKDVSDVYTNLSLIYSDTKRFSEAINYGIKTIVIRSKLKDSVLIAASYQNMGYVYYRSTQMDKALEYFIKTANLHEKIGDKKSLGGDYNNIATISQEQKKYNLALTYYEKSLKWNTEANDVVGLAETNSNLGILYTEIKNFSKAKEHLDIALSIAKKTSNKRIVANVYYSMSDLALAQGDHKTALIYYKRSSNISDSLMDEEKNKLLAEAQTKYETNKKDKEIELLNKDKTLMDVRMAKQGLEVEKQQAQRNVFIVGFGLLLVLSGFIYRGYRQKQKANKDLAEKNLVIEEQKMIVEEKNKSITDSILYAKRIQGSLLPNEKYIDKNLKRLQKK